jgi:hypothetical protein
LDYYWHKGLLCAKKTLYLRIIKEGNLALKDHYSKYCKILKKVIVAAKKMAYDDFISKSHNKLKSTWKIIQSETGRIDKQNTFMDLIAKFKNQNAAEQVNDYFISIGDKLTMSDNIRILILLPHNFYHSCIRLSQKITLKFAMTRPHPKKLKI